MKTRRTALSKREQALARRKRQQLLPVALIAVGGLVLVVVLFFALKGGGNQAVRPAQVGTPLSDFTLVDISGKQVSLSDYKGQVVLVNAWAT